MSSIASGPAIGSGLIVETGALRTIGSSGPMVLGGAPALPAAPAVPVATAAALDAGAAPVDQDRIVTIRKAIADNNYPVIPTKIGDAMIAAGMLLRMAK